MSRFTSVFEELRLLQSRLKATANRLWAIRITQATAYQKGQKENDFLPRRLQALKEEEQIRYDHLLYQLSLFISTHLDSAFIIFDSQEDVATMRAIQKTIRYIRNAFVSGPQVGVALARLNQTLPALSRN